MLEKSRWLAPVALLLGLIQSVLWTALSVIGALVYLCVISISPYKSSEDFLRVTIIKLYFEGPGCIPDGSYLGKFNEDYRNPQVLQLFTPDKVFGVMVAYFILNVGYFFLSIEGWMNRKPKTYAEGKQFRNTLLKWSILTLVISAIDAVLTEELIFDIISLQGYMGDKEAQFEATRNAASVSIAEISYIPLLLAVISSRFVGVWLWNVIIGLIFFFSAMCGRYHPPKNEQKPVVKQEREEINPPTKDRSTSFSLANGAYNGSFDVRNGSDYPNTKLTGTTTRFNTARKIIYPEENLRSWRSIPNDSYWVSPKPQKSQDGWEMTNEGFVEDDQVVEKARDFDHDLKNFERGPRKIKIVNPPIGKPVKE